MKRSNRLMLVLGVVLAAVAFGGVLLFGSSSGTAEPVEPETVPVVTAAIDLPLGTTLEAADLATIEMPVADAVDTYRDPAQIAGLVVRRSVRAGEAFRSADFQSSSGMELPQVAAGLEPGQRAIAVSLAPIDAVGGLLQAGDRVDVVATFTEADGRFPIAVENPGFGRSSDASSGGAPLISLDAEINNTSVKVLVQDLLVLGTMAPEDAPTADERASGSAPAAVLTVVLSVTPQQAELVRFAAVDGNVSLLLRSSADVDVADVATTGVTLRELVASHGVLPPRAVLDR